MNKVVFALFLVFAVVSFAKEAEKKKAPQPQFAGMGLAPAVAVTKHGCTVNYESCMAGCKGVTGATCLNDCGADCNVCALDTGEESSQVCGK